MSKCYIAGKIGALPEEQYRLNFETAKEEVRAMGYEPLSPLDLPHEHARTWKAYMREDIQAMLNCDTVYALTNWITSPGATLEVDVAIAVGLHVIYQSNNRKYE